VPEELRARGRVLAARAGVSREVGEGPAQKLAPLGGRSERPGAPTVDGTRVRAVGLGSESYIVVHPGSGGRAKCWPTERFVEVARELRRAGRAVCFVLGPAEVERGLAPEVERGLEAVEAVRGAPQEGRDGAGRAEGRLADGVLPGEFPVVRCPEPDELLALVAGAAAYLGNDAGPTHLAALVGTPTVALFGPTSPRVWRPLGAQVRVVAGNAGGGADWGLVVAEVVEQIIGVCGGAAV
jgi:ADP-heptose:LPS heptosyltransferase